MDVKSIGLRRRMTLPSPIGATTPYATDAFGQQTLPISSDLTAWETPFLCQTAHAARGDHICIYEQTSETGHGQRLHKLSETPPASANSPMAYPCVVVQTGGSTRRWLVLSHQECEALYDVVEGTFPNEAIALASMHEREGHATFFGAYKSYACHAMPAYMMAGGQFERSLLNYASQQTSDESAWRQVASFGDAATPLLPSARSPKTCYAPTQTLSSKSFYASVYASSRKTSWASLRSVFHHSPTSSLSTSDSWESASQASSRQSPITPDMARVESSALRSTRTQAALPASNRLRRTASLEQPFDADLGTVPPVTYAPDAQAGARVVLPRAPAKSYLPPFLRRSTKAASHDLCFLDDSPRETPHE